jgi:NADPH-dependent 2,4-dienoyl-CoA reductase/sulfur reductase-like enzyme
MDYVIAGCGGAGINAASAIRKLDKKGKIVIISKDDPYTPVFLADYLLGEDESKLHIVEKDFFEKLKLEFIKGEIKQVRDSSVTLNNGEEIGFDRLLIATGSKPFRPPVPGIDKENIFTFHSLGDAARIKEVARESERAAVVGAGPVGLEIAYALTELGLKVFVIEMMERILPGIVDEEIAEMVESEFRRLGVEIITGRKVEEFTGEKKVKSLIAGDEIEVDLAVLSTGVTPNLPEMEGIRIRQGVVVDRRMESSKEGVFAAGDVAEAEDVFGTFCLTPTWTSAVTQGKIAGTNMAGGNVYHEGSIRMNIVKKSDVPVLSVGKMEGDSETFRGGKIFRRAYFDGDFLTGFQSAGIHSDLSLSGLIQFLIKKRVPVKDKKLFVRRPQSFRNWSRLHNLALAGNS